MHGSQKLFGVPGEAISLLSLMGVGGIVELGGSLLIAVGLFTRMAAFLASGQMAVAYFMAHLPQGTAPLLNKGEPSIIYCFLFLYIVAQGPGIWSLDANRQKRP